MVNAISIENSTLEGDVNGISVNSKEQTIDNNSLANDSDKSNKAKLGLELNNAAEPEPSPEEYKQMLEAYVNETMRPLDPLSIQGGELTYAKQVKYNTIHRNLHHATNWQIN